MKIGLRKTGVYIPVRMVDLCIPDTLTVSSILLSPFPSFPFLFLPLLPLHSLSVEGSRLMALQKLWNYILSIVAGNVLKWNIVITRFGKPSNSEIRGTYRQNDPCLAWLQGAKEWLVLVVLGWIWPCNKLEREQRLVVNCSYSSFFAACL